MNYSWMDEAGYKTEIEEVRNDIMQRSNVAKTESDTADAIKTVLFHYVKNKTGIDLYFHAEKKIVGIYKVDEKKNSGRLDAVVNKLVFEFKKKGKLDKEKDQEAAIKQVEDYLKALYKSEKIKYNAVLTDGMKICYFSCRDDVIKQHTMSNDDIIVEHTAFNTMQAKDLDRIIKACLINQSKRFVSANILKDFSINAQVETVSKKLAHNLYEKLKFPKPKTEMLYEEWKRLMHLSCDDSGKGNDIEKRRRDLDLIFSTVIDDANEEYKALFALQTAYAIIVKLIACKVIDKIDDIDAGQTFFSDLTNKNASDIQKFMEKLENGFVYKSRNVINFLEGDFFSWYSAKDQGDVELWEIIKDIIACVDEYSAFSFDISYEPVDIFKDLYMSMIPKSVRHSMGEYFTPAWLADYVITEGLKLQKNKEWRAIDPCCGSGTFVISLIKHIVGDVRICDLSNDEKKDIITRIVSSVYGIDINPLSVLSARVGYYLALKPFGDIKDIEIPIYLGDAAIVPSRETVVSNDL